MHNEHTVLQVELKQEIINNMRYDEFDFKIKYNFILESKQMSR